MNPEQTHDDSPPAPILSELFGTTQTQPQTRDDSLTTAYQTIDANPEANWDWNTISRRKDMPLWFFEKYMDRHFMFDLKFAHYAFTDKFIEKYCTEHMRWRSLSRNPHIAEYIIANFKTKPWNFRNLSGNGALSMEFILKHKEAFPEWEFVTDNPNLTEEFIDTHPKLPWSWYAIRFNAPQISPECFARHGQDYDDFDE